MKNLNPQLLYFCAYIKGPAKSEVSVQISILHDQIIVI